MTHSWAKQNVTVSPAYEPREDTFKRPLDAFLWGLRETGLSYRPQTPPEDLNARVVAQCPVCPPRGYLALTLTEKREGGYIQINCEFGCSPNSVRALLVSNLTARVGTACLNFNFIRAKELMGLCERLLP